VSPVHEPDAAVLDDRKREPVGRGHEREEIWSLHDLATRLLGPGAKSVGLVTTLDSIDTELAWGVKQLQSRELFSRSDWRMGLPTEEPLGADGDIWRAAVDTAHRHGTDLVVITAHEPGWPHRILVGSAVQIPLERGDLPILAIPEAALHP
jgi:hypothetical protein